MDKSDIVTFMNPSNPERTYAGKGWVSWKDWLGTDYLAFDAARCLSEPFRKFVTDFLIGKLDLTNQGELVKFMTWRYSLQFRGLSKVHQRLSQPRWPAWNRFVSSSWTWSGSSMLHLVTLKKVKCWTNLVRSKHFLILLRVVVRSHSRSHSRSQNELKKSRVGV